MWTDCKKTKSLKLTYTCAASEKPDIEVDVKISISESQNR
jgi:hypothetical protein